MKSSEQKKSATISLSKKQNMQLQTRISERTSLAKAISTELTCYLSLAHLKRSTLTQKISFQDMERILGSLNRECPKEIALRLALQGNFDSFIDMETLETKNSCLPSFLTSLDDMERIAIIDQLYILSINEGTSTYKSLIKDFFDETNVSFSWLAADLLVQHRQVIETALFDQIQTLFSLPDSVTLFDLTNTYFEGEMAINTKAKRGRSKEKRSLERLDKTLHTEFNDEVDHA